MILVGIEYIMKVIQNSIKSWLDTKCMVKTIDAKVLIKGIMCNVSGLLTLVYWILDSLNTTGLYHIGTKLRNNCRKEAFLKITFTTAKSFMPDR